MTHRHLKFWRDKANRVFSRAQCGADIQIPVTADIEERVDVDLLRERFYSPTHESIHPEVVMDGNPSMCEECESIYGLKLLAEVDESEYITLNEVSRGGWRK
jgi:hypothetical protein